MKYDNYKVTRDFSDARLDRWIKYHYKKFRQSDIEVALRKKKIRINNKKIKSNYRLQLFDLVSIAIEFRSLREEKNKIFSMENKKEINNMIIFQDDELLVLNKPAGIAVQGGTKITKNIDNLLRTSFKSTETKLVHRLDKETSGVLIVALNRNIANYISLLFREKRIVKTYWSLNTGKFKKGKGVINRKIKKKNSNYYYTALTEYNNYMKINNNLNFFIFKPITGRNHQIRIHSKYLGIPVLGDKKYGFEENDEKLHLHSRSIEFNHPNGNRMFFKADLPKHMSEKWEKYKLPYDVTI